MDPLARGSRWLRARRARRLRDRARHGSGTDPETVEALSEFLAADGPAREIAAEGLEVVARTGDDGSARAAATDRLVSTVGAENPDLAARAARSLRYVALRRPGVVPRIDGPYADVLSDPRHGAHRPVAVDAGMVLSRVDGAAADLPATREALRETLLGGPDDARRHAGVAYAIAADRAGAFADPRTIAEGLAILGSRDGSIPASGSTARRLAEGRTVADAVTAFRAAGGVDVGDDGTAGGSGGDDPGER